MIADNRTVATDALATLGTIIDASQKRDAIHLAVIPVVAGMDLVVGDDIGIRNGEAFNNGVQNIGIVDPFLKEAVHKGQNFWLVIYPRVITSLRHVWTHPAIENEATSTSVDQQAAIQWLTEYAERMDTTYDKLIFAIEHNGCFDGQPNYYDKDPQDCKPYYEIATGRRWPSGVSNYFSCSC